MAGAMDENNLAALQNSQNRICIFITEKKELNQTNKLYNENRQKP